MLPIYRGNSGKIIRYNITTLEGVITIAKSDIDLSNSLLYTGLEATTYKRHFI